MKQEYIKNEYGETVGVRTSYEIESQETKCEREEHDMEYPQTLGVVGGKCRNCDYSTM